jgi:hypothetical protein
MSRTYTMRQARDIIMSIIRDDDMGHGQFAVPYLEGDPGIGKTSLHQTIYNEFRRYVNDDIKSAFYPDPETGKKVDNILHAGGFTHFIPYIAPEREPTDWGLPFPIKEEGCIQMLPLKDFKFLPTDRPYIFLDEIDKANNMMQNVLGRIMNEQKVGDIVFPKGTFVGAAGNKITNRAGGFTANSHIKNRREHIPVAVDAKEWIEDVAIPWDLHSAVVSQVRTDPGILHKLDLNNPSFPSPRSWTKVGKLLNIEGMADHVERARVEGNIGIETANTFWGHLKIFRALRNLEEIVRNPTKCKIPEGKDSVPILYAEITALAKNADEKTADPIMTYFNRLPGEYGFIGYRDIMLRNKSLITRSKAGQSWMVANASLLQATKA